MRSSGFTGCGCPPETNALTMPMTAQKRGSLWSIIENDLVANA
jgi:hypothetical protein